LISGNNILGVETPFTSFYKLQECVYLYNRGIAYNGDVCSFPPLLLLSPLIDNDKLWKGIFIFLDLAIAFILYKTAKVYEKENDKESISLDPKGIAIWYLLNPYSILACAGKSLGILCNFFVVGAIYTGLKKELNKSLVLISIASYLGLYPILLIPALLIHFSKFKSKSEIIKGLILFLLFTASLLVLSSAMIQSWKWLDSTYKVQILASDLSPNIGLWWYFFIQVFDTFRMFFVCLFQFLVIIFVVPISLKFRYFFVIFNAFRNDFLFTVYIIITILAIFKSYPSLSDTSLSLTLLSLFPNAINYATSSFIMTNALLYASFLGPLFFNLWIYASSGNANFFYAITLVWAYFHMSFLLEVIGGYLRREWDGKYPELRKARVEVSLI
jgi:phosphatidylinositol glycan class U